MTQVAAAQAVRNTSDSHEYGRPAIIEDASNRYFIHPVSDWVVTLAYRLHISPNAVSLLGMGCGLLAAFLYYELPRPEMVIGGFLAMVGWHILDGADGRLARLTGKTSAFGRIIDGICDHVVFAAVYVALALHLVETGASVHIWWLVVGAGLSHAIQAAGYEERRQKYQRRLKGVERVKVEQSLLIVDGKRSLLALLYDRAQKLVSGGDYGLDGCLASLRAAGKGARASALVAKTVPMVKAWGLLNANNRTLLIFLFAFIGQPAFFFAFELIVLNIVLLILILAEWRAEKALVAVATDPG